MQGRKRVRTLSVQRPQPHTSNPWKEEKDKTIGDKKESHHVYVLFNTFITFMCYLTHSSHACVI